jgi:hypothetical protein
MFVLKTRENGWQQLVRVTGGPETGPTNVYNLDPAMTSQPSRHFNLAISSVGCDDRH